MPPHVAVPPIAVIVLPVTLLPLAIIAPPITVVVRRCPAAPCHHRAACFLAALAGNVFDISRHVTDDTLCRSNFGQMGPCRRHNFFDVVAVCVG